MVSQYRDHVQLGAWAQTLTSIQPRMWRGTGYSSHTSHVTFPMVFNAGICTAGYSPSIINSCLYCIIVCSLFPACLYHVCLCVHTEKSTQSPCLLFHWTDCKVCCFDGVVQFGKIGSFFFILSSLMIYHVTGVWGPAIEYGHEAHVNLYYSPCPHPRRALLNPFLFV